MKIKNPEQLRARAEALRQQAIALDLEAQTLDASREQNGWKETEATAQRALNGWDTARMRQSMKDLRELQRILLKTDCTKHFAWTLQLNVLFESLRAKSDKVERARFVKRLYVENPGSNAREIAQLLDKKWDDYAKGL